MPIAWEPSDPAIDEEIIRLYKSGLGGDKIIEMLSLDCSRPSIIKWLKRNGVSINSIGNKRLCKNCNQKFLISNYAQLFCRDCVSTVKGWHFLDKYGLLEKDYNNLMENQNNCCACCGEEFTKKTKICVDHCHKQGHVRGLICNSCNIGLGFIENDKRLAQAFRYIEQHKR